MSVHLMENVIQPYDWGARTSIASIQGRAAPDGPEAEMWMGSHAKAPSFLPDIDRSLVDLIRANPDDAIGSRAQSLNPDGDDPAQLPFLFKILAAAKGLSIQAHPDRDGAAVGFAAEERAGIDRLAPNRNYRDRNHKPELICALEPFYGLCGFREFEEIAAELRGLHTFLVRTESSAAALEIAEQTRLYYDKPTSENLKLWFTSVSNLLLDGYERARREFTEALERFAETKLVETHGGGRKDDENRYWWTVELLRQFPGDPGAAGPLFLNLFSLNPGEAVFLGPRILHAYLRGTGIEIMANSDNVLRAGCTVKHVDPAELAKVLVFEGRRPTRVAPESKDDVERFVTPASEFELSRARVVPGAPVAIAIADAPAVVLAIGGVADVAGRGGNTVRLEPGASCFVTSSEGGVSCVGDATLFVASLPGAVSVSGASA